MSRYSCPYNLSSKSWDSTGVCIEMFCRMKGVSQKEIHTSDSVYISLDNFEMSICLFFFFLSTQPLKPTDL